MRSFMTAVVAAAALVAVAGCPSPGPPRGGGTSEPVLNKDRQTALVVVNDGSGGCLAKVAERHNARKNDTVTWQVWNYCDAAKQVEVVFTEVNPLTGVQPAQPSGASRRWSDIKGRVTGDPGVYPYEVRVNGVRAVDPQLEIDP